MRSPVLSRAHCIAYTESIMAGRPSTEVDMNSVQYLKTIGMPMTDIAKLMGVSRQTLYNKIQVSGNPSDYATYTSISDRDLDQLVTRIKQHHPNNGEVMLAGYLTSEGVRVSRKRLRASIHRVDQAGTEDR